jgi:hypothetical protein
MKLEYDPDNQIAPEEVLKYLSSHYKLCKDKFGIELLFVVEGNELVQKKEVARSKRDSIKSKAKQEYKDYFNKCIDSPHKITDSDRSKFELTLKSLVSRSEKITSFVVSWMKKNSIPFIGAPFEGEWQLVCMEMDN